MKIDVIIPVYRPTEKLHKVLYRLCRQTHLPEQIILLHTRDGIKLDVSVCKDRVSVTEIPILEKEFDHGRTREQDVRCRYCGHDDPGCSSGRSVSFGKAFRSIK